jgi:hypothetical protein
VRYWRAGAICTRSSGETKWSVSWASWPRAISTRFTSPVNVLAPVDRGLDASFDAKARRAGSRVPIERASLGPWRAFGGFARPVGVGEGLDADDPPLADGQEVSRCPSRGTRGPMRRGTSRV